jgi:hypothetical protein
MKFFILAGDISNERMLGAVGILLSAGTIIYIHRLFQNAMRRHKRNVEELNILIEPLQIRATLNGRLKNFSEIDTHKISIFKRVGRKLGQLAAINSKHASRKLQRLNFVV